MTADAILSCCPENENKPLVVIDSMVSEFLGHHKDSREVIYSKMKDDTAGYEPPIGESIEDLKERAGYYYRLVKSSGDNKLVFIVTHGFFMTMLSSHIPKYKGKKKFGFLDHLYISNMKGGNPNHSQRRMSTDLHISNERHTADGGSNKSESTISNSTDKKEDIKDTQ